MKTKKNHHLIYLLTLGIIILSCSKDGSVDIDKGAQETDFNVYENVTKDLKQFLQSQKNPTFEKMIKFSETIEGVDSTVVIDSVLYIYSQGGYKFFYDLYGKYCRYPSQETLDIDKIKSTIDSIKTTESLFSHKDYITKSENKNSTLLNRKNALVWAPWSKFAKEDTTNLFPILRLYDVSYALNLNCDPDFFSTFADYDLVFISSHGSLDGILIPENETNWKLYEKYIKNNKSAIGWITNEGYAILLDQQVFKTNLPDLSNTVIWTIACYLGHKDSKFYNCASEKNCADFFGADNICNGFGPANDFMHFAPSFYYGATSEKSFDFPGHDYKSYKFVRKGVKDVYLFKPVTVSVQNVVKNASCVEIVFWGPTGIITEAFEDFLYSKHNIYPEFSAGIYLKNKKNNQDYRVPINAENIRSISQTKVDNKHTYLSLYVELNNLESETTYEYCPYIYNGNYCYAKKYYSFTTVKENEELLLYTSKDLETFRENIFSGNSYKDVKVKLMNDIQISNYEEWKRLRWADEEKYIFEGEFDGQGHTISNIYYYWDGFQATNQGYGDVISLFATNNGIIKNVKINVSTDTPYGFYSMCSGITRFNNGTIDNCECIIKFGRAVNAGAISSVNRGIISNCKIYGCMDSQTYSGGISEVNSGSIVNCENHADIISEFAGVVGGIVTYNYGLIESCRNYGLVKQYKQHPEQPELDSEGDFPGICWNNSEGSIIDCKNFGRFE